ncbi:MAG: hypothetical protein WB992_10260 [Bryobacteraceae bacterium]
MYPKKPKSYLFASFATTLLLSAALAQPLCAQEQSNIASLFDHNYNGVRTDYIGVDQHVHELFLSGATWQDADLTAIAGGMYLSAESGLKSIGDGYSARVYYIGAEQDLHQLLLSGGFWSDLDLSNLTNTVYVAAGSAIGSLFDTGDSSDANFEVIHTDYVGDDQDIHELSISGDASTLVSSTAWTDTDLTVSSNASTYVAGGSSGLVNIVDPVNSSGSCCFDVRTYYIGAEQDVHELFYSGGAWQDGDLTMIAGGPSAAAGSKLASLFDTVYNGVRTYYIGADQDVHELFLSGSTWQDADLSAITGGPHVTPGSALATLYDSKYSGVRTDYVATDQHVHELFLSGGMWQDADLTSIAGGINVSGGSGLVGIVDPVYSNAVRDYYVGTDQHVHELFLSGGVWSDGDITLITGASVPVANYRTSKQPLN